MQHTTKYNFNLIETSDAFGPERLNENTQKVEDKLAALETADNALVAADLALAQADADNKSQLQAAIQKAQSAADAAQAAANAAQAAASTAQSTASTARAEAAVLPFKVGAYQGNNKTQTIEVGFRPSLVIIFAVPLLDPSDNHNQLSWYFLIADATHYTKLVTFTDTGFTVYRPETTTYPMVNASSPYEYIAFR